MPIPLTCTAMICYKMAYNACNAPIIWCNTVDHSGGWEGTSSSRAVAATSSSSSGN